MCSRLVAQSDDRIRARVELVRSIAIPCYTASVVRQLRPAPMNPTVEAEEAARPAPAAPTGLKGRMIRAAAWNLSGHMATQILALGSHLVLQRLLFPEAFGIMAIVQLVMTGLHMFSDVGVRPALIQSPRGDDPVFLNTAWTIQVIRGFTLTVCATLCAWPMAWFYEQPQLIALIPVASLTAALGGLESISLIQLERAMTFRPLILLELACQSLSIVVMVTLAWLHPSPWALVAGGLSAYTARAIASHTVLRGHRPRLVWDRESAAALFRFGTWIFLSTMFTFLGGQGDRALLGHYLGLAVLGVYGAAIRISEAVANVHTKLVHSVLYPALSETFRTDPSRMLVRYDKSRIALDALGMPAAGFLFVAGEPIVRILFAEEFHGAGWMLELLSIQLGMRCMLGPAETLLFSIGRTHYGFSRSLVRAIWILAGVPIAWHVHGEIGVFWCVALSEVPVLLVLTYGLLRNRLYSFAIDLRSLLLFAAGAGCAALAELALGT